MAKGDAERYYNIARANPISKAILKLTYVKIARFFLVPVSLLRRSAVGERTGYIDILHRHFLVFSASAIFSSCLYYLYAYYSSIPFLKLGHHIICLWYNTVAAGKVVVSGYTDAFRDITHLFFNELHLWHFKGQPGFHDEIIEKVDKFSLYYSVYFFIGIFGASIFFSFVPLMNSFTSGAFQEIWNHQNTTLSLEVPIYAVFGFNYENNITGWVVVTLYEVYISMMTGFVLGSTELLMILLVFQIYGHSENIKKTLDDFKPPEGNEVTKSELGSEISGERLKFNDEENEDIKERLILAIRHHIFVKKSMSSIIKCFGFNIFHFYLFATSALCIILLEFSEMTPATIILYGPLALTLLAETVQMSACFEIAASSMESLPEYVYALPWEYMNYDNRRAVMLFLMFTQSSVDRNAAGMTHIGVDSMQNVIKTTFSFFMLLRKAKE